MLKQTNTIKSNISLTKELLNDRFDSIDYNNAKKDVKPFIKDLESLNLCKSQFFKLISIDIIV